MKNDDFDSELANLWQQQPVLEVDAADIRKTANRMRLKQAFYVFLDLATIVFSLVVLIVMRDKFSTVSFWGLVAILGLAVLATLYIVYLRRHALLLRVGSESTREYLMTLLAQARNNVKIAWITKHSCWVCFITLVGFWLLVGMFDDMPHDKWLKKTLLGSGLTFVLMVAMWFWASWRERKFSRLVESLNNQLAQLDKLV